MQPTHTPSGETHISVNTLAAPLAAALVDDADALRLGVETLAGGARIIDAGINRSGGIEAGRRIAEICLGGLGRVQLTCVEERWPLRISVHSSTPVLACLGSQYAGWSLAHGEGKGSFRAFGSGPGRALAVKEQLYEELGYRDRSEHACLVLEVDKQPPTEIVDKVVHDCGIRHDGLTLILTPTASLAGVVQIVARVLEVALHKAHALGFPLSQLIEGAGTAPVAPPGGDFLTAMGRTNDAILFGGTIHLFVTCTDAEAKDLTSALPSSASGDYGRPFAKVFEAYEHDFYRIDPMLFAPAVAVVTNLGSGNTFRAGKLNEPLLAASFGALEP